MKRIAISLSDYNRIYQVAHGVLRQVGEVEHASMFFASFGSMMLNKHFKIPARPVAGAFAICVDDLPEVAAFGTVNGDKLTSDDAGFHTWVQTENHIIDFMGPIYPEAFAKRSFEKPIERRMFQRPRSEQTPSANLAHAGDFLALPNTELTDRLLTKFLARPRTHDLMIIGETWFGRRSGKQKPTSTITNDLGTTYRLSLPNHAALTAW
jgi:hypothetical protein